MQENGAPWEAVRADMACKAPRHAKTCQGCSGDAANTAEGVSIGVP